MFEISWGELVLIGMIALVVIGPKELPTVLRTVGQFVGKIRRMAAEFQGQFQEAMREAELAELRKQVESIGDNAKINTDFNPLETARREIEGALQDKPATEGALSAAPEPSAPAAPSGPAPLAAADAPPAMPAEAALPQPASVSEPPAAPAPPSTPADLPGGRAA